MKPSFQFLPDDCKHCVSYLKYQPVITIVPDISSYLKIILSKEFYNFARDVEIKFSEVFTWRTTGNCLTESTRQQCLAWSHVQNNNYIEHTLIFIHYLKNVACLSRLESLSNKPFIYKCCVFAFLDLTMRKIACLWNLVPVRQQTKWNLTLLVQIPHPTQAKVKFLGTPQVQVIVECLFLPQG